MILLFSSPRVLNTIFCCQEAIELIAMTTSTQHLRRLDGLAHRGGLATQIPRLRPEQGLIHRIGGRKVLENVVNRLYERIAEDPLLRPLFGGRVRGEHSVQKQFFEEWAGGEPRYRRAATGSGMFLLRAISYRRKRQVFVMYSRSRL